MKKITALFLCAVLLIGLCGSWSPAAEAASDKPIHLSLGHIGSLEHLYHQTALKFAEEVSEKTDGKVIIDIYPSSQLGSAAEMIEAVKTGTLDITLTADGDLATYVPSFNVIPMPGLFDGFDGVRTFVASDAARRMEQDAHEQGLEVIGWAAAGFRHIISKTPIESAADIVGVKMRIPNMSFYADEYTLLETTVIPLAAGDTYTGISTGIADMCEDAPQNILSKKFYEILDYVAIVGLNFTSEPMVMNSAKLASLPEDVQTIIREAAFAACAEEVDLSQADEENVMKQLTELGMTITHPDVDSFRVKVVPMAEMYAEKYGQDFLDLYNEILALKDK